MRRWFGGLILCASALLGCASYDGASLAPGATGQEVRLSMGDPAAIYPPANGGESWAYPRGPSGLHTFMVRFDVSGRLLRIDQVLAPSVFAQLRIGQDGQANVARLLGPHWRSEFFPRQKEWVWTWRFRNDWGNPAQLQVTFDEAGLVKRWAQIEEDRRKRRLIED